jgi:L-lactate dehydrogenase complex protein LldG
VVGEAMSDAKSEVLARVRGAAEGRAADYAAIPREYRRSGALDAAGRLALFEDRLRDYDAGVYRSSPADLPATIASVAAARGKRRLVGPAGLPKEWLPAGVAFVADDGESYTALDTCEGAVTACAAAVALTGTIILAHSPAEGRRALTLVPDYHLCIVRAEQVVETVPEGLHAVAAIGSGLVTTISGPSATADIEMTRIKGVHGPRFLDVILVI